MLKNITATVQHNEKIAEGIVRIVLHCPDADIAHFVPGQFAHLRVPGHDELLLGRPISVNDADEIAQTVTLICQICGKGTKALSQMQSGTELGAILPIGRGFNLQSAEKTVFLVGGGVGIAPLPTVIKRWPDKSYEAFLGYKSRTVAYGIDDFSACEALHIASEDGSIGEKGYVTSLLKKRIAERQPDVVLACGPVPMLCALKKLMEPLDIKCQASLEQRMCCGFGACAACVCAVKTQNGADYKKVCVEGPVFDLDEVML